MSGVLVGEVHDAAAALKAKGLSESAFHALIAIAEKCHEHNRQGSVRWSHIQGVIYGEREQLPSEKTARRAVTELKNAGLLRVVRRGWNNNAGQSCAPIYEVLSLTDLDTQVSKSPPTDLDIRGTDLDIDGGRHGHPGVQLDGTNDGSNDGDALAHATQPPSVISAAQENPEPTRYCPKHMPHGTTDKCGPCGAAGRKYRAWKDEQNERERVRAAARRQAIAACTICDGTGFVEVHDDSVKRCDCNPQRQAGAA